MWQWSNPSCTHADEAEGHEDVDSAVGALARYAARGARAQWLLAAPEVGEAWQAFAARTAQHRADMRGVASAPSALKPCSGFFRTFAVLGGLLPVLPLLGNA